MKNTILIFGNGPTACQAAGALRSRGFPTCLVTPEKLLESILPESRTASEETPLTRFFPETGLTAFTGTAGNFLATLRTGQTVETFAVQGVVIAAESNRLPNFSAYGLAPGASVLSISDLVFRTTAPNSAPEPWSGISNVVFLLDLCSETHPIQAWEIMHAAKTLQTDFGKQSYILTGNLKVAAEGLESLYQDCRAAGVVFVKFTETRPKVLPNFDGSTQIIFSDEITGDRYELAADLLVVDETIQPVPWLKDLARIMRLETDAQGFIQADNVHRLPVFTNRKGVFAAGPSRGVPLPEGSETDVSNICLGMEMILQGTGFSLGDKATIHPGQCIRCLTCYRVCPYDAIVLGARPEVIPDVCERCGICAAECPREAVTLPDLTKQAVARQVQQHYQDHLPTKTPLLVAFCCSRSAAVCHDMALENGASLPANLLRIQVPCAGSVSPDHLFSAFRNGADGVLVLTCHEGNCHSHRGNRYALDRVDLIRQRLGAIGIDPNRLHQSTLASNMPTEYSEIVQQFEKRILQLNQVTS